MFSINTVCVNKGFLSFERVFFKKEREREGEAYGNWKEIERSKKDNGDTGNKW